MESNTEKGQAPPQAWGANPAMPQTAVVGAQPRDYLIPAILTTIFCFLPFGLIAICKSSSVRNKYASGDVLGAEEASRSAKCWSCAALTIGIVAYVIGIVVLVIYIVFIASIFASF